jgi:hypothetical protein
MKSVWPLTLTSQGEPRQHGFVPEEGPLAARLAGASTQGDMDPEPASGERSNEQGTKRTSMAKTSR